MVRNSQIGMFKGNTPDEEYNSSHPNALSDGDILGKGTGSGGHQHWLPKCTDISLENRGPENAIDYSNFDTFNGGGSCDIEMRNKSMVRSMYDAEHPYYGANANGAEIVDLANGLQYRVGEFNLDGLTCAVPTL